MTELQIFLLKSFDQSPFGKIDFVVRDVLNLIVAGIYEERVDSLDEGIGAFHIWLDNETAVKDIPGHCHRGLHNITKLLLGSQTVKERLF